MRLGLLTVHDGMIAVNRAFDAVNRGRVQIALDEDLTPDVRDFRTIAARVKQMPGIDALALFLMPGQAGLCARQFREAGVSLPIIGAAALSTKGEVEVAQGALRGARHYDSAVNPEFLQRFWRRDCLCCFWHAQSGDWQNRFQQRADQ